jgi:hypothetical protein
MELPRLGVDSKCRIVRRSLCSSVDITSAGVALDRDVLQLDARNVRMETLCAQAEQLAWWGQALALFHAAPFQVSPAVPQAHCDASLPLLLLLLFGTPSHAPSVCRFCSAFSLSRRPQAPCQCASAVRIRYELLLRSPSSPSLSLQFTLRVYALRVVTATARVLVPSAPRRPWFKLSQSQRDAGPARARGARGVQVPFRSSGPESAARELAQAPST